MLKDAVNYRISQNEKIRIVQVTDPHLFADPEGQLLGVNTLNSLNAVVNTINAVNHQADFVLATGDLSQDYSGESYHHFVNSMLSLNLPCHYLPGNHDDPRIMNLHMQGNFIHSQKRILAGNWQIIMLDSTIKGKPGGYLADEEIKFINQSIKEEPDRHVLLAMHHNPVLAGCAWLDQHCMANGDAFLSQMQQFPQVKAMLWGHVHQQLDSSYDGEHGEIVLMSTPSTCIQFKPQSSYFALDTAQPGYRFLELEPDGKLTTTVYRLPGEFFAPDMDSIGY